MNQITITGITGGTYPISVYIYDSFGNNETLLGSINPGPVPPEVSFSSVIPSKFDMAPQILLKLIDSENCILETITICT